MALLQQSLFVKNDSAISENPLSYFEFRKTMISL